MCPTLCRLALPCWQPARGQADNAVWVQPVPVPCRLQGVRHSVCISANIAGV